MRSTSVRGTAGVAVLGVAVAAALTGGLLAAGSDAVRGDLRVRTASAVSVVDDEGVRRTLAAGDELRDGDVLESSDGGTALLERGDGLVYVGPASVLGVDDGELRLRRGDVALDAREDDLPPLRAGDVELRGEDGVLRATAARSVRVAALVGDVDVRAPGASDAAAVVVPALHQVTTAAGVVPRTSDPLVLRRDALEAQVIPLVLELDRVLAGLAAGLPADVPAPVLPVVAALDGAVPGGVQPAGAASSSPASASPALASPSETVFAVALARAAPSDALDPDPLERARQVSDLHRRSGSWGVVGSIVGAAEPDVRAALAGLLGAAGTAVPAAPAAPGAPVAATGGDASGAATAPPGAPAAAVPTAPATRAPAAPATTPPSVPAVPVPPAPSRPANPELPLPLDELGGAVEDVVDGLAGTVGCVLTRC